MEDVKRGYPSTVIKVSVQEAKARLSTLLAAVEERGEVVVILRNGRPVAELRSAVGARDPFQVHPVLSRVVFREDPVAPLQPGDWLQERTSLLEAEDKGLEDSEDLR